jgi:TP901 family phage tail tape measure protein
LNAFNTAKTEQEQVTAFNQLNNSVKDSKIQVNDLVKTYQTLNRIEASSGSFEKYVQQNPQVLKKHAQEVADIKNQWKQVAQETDITKLQTGFKEANTATSAFKGEIRSLGQEGRTAFGELGNDLKKFAQWIGVGGLLAGAIGQIKEGIQTINSLNKSMTDIQMITGMSASKVGNLTKQYSDLASQLHETTTSIMTASEEFLRAGNSADETASLLKASTVMSKIAGQTQEESAQSLISIMNAYKMKASDMMSVVDKLVAVDNISATSTEELSTAIQKTAASAQETGVSFSQLVSWIGEVSSVSRQSADTIGTAFNSIFSRYEKVKAGANTDDQGEAVNDVEKVLKKFDISIRDQSNNFINFNTVLTEVANKWSTLNTVERGQISTALAGTKQRNQFLILMQNFNKTLELQSAEANSAGNAMNRYGTYATSTQAKIDDFINTLQKFWQNVVNSSVINGVVGAGTDVINVISGINSKLGAIPTLIGAITAALSVTKNVGKIYAYAA